jgi:hypothetical protein
MPLWIGGVHITPCGNYEKVLLAEGGEFSALKSRLQNHPEERDRAVTELSNHCKATSLVAWFGAVTFNQRIGGSTPPRWLIISSLNAVTRSSGVHPHLPLFHPAEPPRECDAQESP